MVFEYSSTPWLSADESLSRKKHAVYKDKRLASKQGSSGNRSGKQTALQDVSNMLHEVKKKMGKSGATAARDMISKIKSPSYSRPLPLSSSAPSLTSQQLPPPPPPPPSLPPPQQHVCLKSPFTYIDQYNNIQGPYPGSALLGWTEQGYFPMDTMVRWDLPGDTEPWTEWSILFRHLKES